MTYNGRRGPNISQFLRELQENPTLVENDAAFSMDDTDLSMFTNTEFFDLETGQNTDFQPQQHPPKPVSESNTASSVVSPLGDDALTTIADFSNIDFMTTGTDYPLLLLPFAKEKTSFSALLLRLHASCFLCSCVSLFSASFFPLIEWLR